jgi:hypothetical protein
MGFDPRSSEGTKKNSVKEGSQHSQLDPETITRIDNALQGTIEVDIANLSPDDKLTLLIDRYNRKMREIQQMKNMES